MLEFDEAYTAFVEGFERLPDEEQLLALQRVDAQLAGMVRAQDAELWTERARREDGVWDEVRELAEGVIRVFGWPGVGEMKAGSGSCEASGGVGG